MLVHSQGCREAASIVEDLGVVVHREAAAECEKKAKQNFLYAGGCVLIWIALAALMQFC